MGKIKNTRICWFTMVIYALIIGGIIIFLPIFYLLYLKVFSTSPPTTTTTTLKDRKGFVIKDIQPENIKGKVKIIQSSKVWSATADEKIEAGTKVKINEVEGVHLIVEDIGEEMEELSEIDKGSQEHTEQRGPSDSIRDGWFSTKSLFHNMGENISLGTLIVIVGLLIIISVTILKFVGPGELPLIGEYPVGDINPNDHLSIHFFLGIVIGIIVMIIGGALSIINKKETVEELEEQ